MTEFIQVMTTVGTREDAQRIADVLVEQRLAGCVQVIGPITSAYRWEGAVQTDEEWLCVIKTSAALYFALERELEEVHPYDLPEILAVPLFQGSQAYLEWLGDALRSSPSEAG
ncbi:MAG: divalent-cation tolerance protein CutA [Anaerolineae bacterium]|jgi:periplasmic divalent cation tolerance protein